MTVLVLWASAFPAIRAGLQGYDPARLTLLRYLVASLVLLVLATMKTVQCPQSADFPRVTVLGGVGIAAYNLCLNAGETHVTAGAASLLVNTVPVQTALLSWMFLGERLGTVGVLGIGLSFLGSSIVALGGTGDHSINWWAALIVGAALCQATYFVLQKPLLARYRPFELTCYAIWSGTALCLVFAPGLIGTIQRASARATLAVLYLGAFPAALAYFAWALVLARKTAQQASSLLFAIPVLSLIIAWVWLGEVPSMLMLVGGGIALAGVALANSRAASIASRNLLKHGSGS